MNRRLLAALALTGSVLLTAACAGTDGSSWPAADDDGLFAVGDREPAPPISGQGLDGQPLDVADYRGQVVVVNVWGQWCPPCRAEAPFLNQVAEQTASQGVQFLGINVKDDRADAQRFDAQVGTPYPSIYDQPGVTLSRFRKAVPSAPPFTMLLDRQGRISGVLFGGQTVDALLRPVQALAAE